MCLRNLFTRSREVSERSTFASSACHLFDPFQIWDTTPAPSAMSNLLLMTSISFHTISRHLAVYSFPPSIRCSGTVCVSLCLLPDNTDNFWLSAQFMPYSLFALCFSVKKALRQWRRGTIALITAPPAPDSLNLVQHLQPRCLEDRFLPQQTRKSQSSVTAAPHEAPSGSPQTSRHLASCGKGDPWEDDSPELSSQVPRLHGILPPAWPNCWAPHPGEGSRLCAHLPRQRGNIVLSTLHR